MLRGYPPIPLAGMGLTVALVLGCSGLQGARVEIWDCDGGGNQTWHRQ